ncbi:MAG: hypothetical protein Tsb009_06650 [Planctomycetaceae bacterium]
MSTTENTPEIEVRPTRMRHYVVASGAMMSMLLYLDRFCVGIAEPYIKQDLGLSTLQMGFFFSAFFLTYALFQVPSGWMTDRFGSRVMLVTYVLTWSFFTAMMGLSYGFVMLLLMRAAYGIGQSGAYPTSASIISKWVPFSNRGTASSIIALGGRVGGAIAPLLTAFLIVMFVPVSRSSLLKPDDVLKPDELCYAIAPPVPEGAIVNNAEPRNEVLQEAEKKWPKFSQRMWNILDEKSKNLIAEVAVKFHPVAERITQLEKEANEFKKQRRFVAARDKQAEADSLRVKLSDDQLQQLTDAINSVVQSDRFYTANDEAFADLQLASALEKFQMRIDAGETLTPEEMARFNRLLLEKKFPTAIGKVYVAGWRPVMISYGLLGLIVAVVLWVVLRNRPEEHPRCNQAERALIEAGRPANAPSPHGKTRGVPLKRLLKSGSMWMNSISQVGTNIGWIFIPMWFPRYLSEVYDVPLIQRGTMTMIPMLVGWFGMLGGGRLTDFMVSKVGLKWGRRIPWGGSRFIAMSAFLMCPFLDNPWAVTIAMSVVAFSTDLGTASGWAFTQDVGGKYVGSVLGWGNMWGNLGATISPILLAWVFSTYDYQTMFMVCAGAFVVAGICGLGIDATIPIAPPDEQEESTD